MKLRGRTDVAQKICSDKGIETNNPLAIVVGNDKLYGLYKVTLYTTELRALKDLYLVHPTCKTKEDIQYYVDCTIPLCDFCVSKGIKVDKLYILIEECLDIIKS